jgi:hypothetical protein
MAISVTWPNVFKMMSLAAVMLSAVLGGAMAVFERRLDDRMTFYQAEQQQLVKRIERLEQK